MSQSLRVQAALQLSNYQKRTRVIIVDIIKLVKLLFIMEPVAGWVIKIV